MLKSSSFVLSSCFLVSTFLPSQQVFADTPLEIALKFLGSASVEEALKMAKSFHSKDSEQYMKVLNYILKFFKKEGLLENRDTFLSFVENLKDISQNGGKVALNIIEDCLNSAFKGDYEKFCTYLYKLPKEYKGTRVLEALVSASNKAKGHAGNIPAIVGKEKQAVFLGCLSHVTDELAAYRGKFDALKSLDEEEQKVLSDLNICFSSLRNRVDSSSAAEKSAAQVVYDCVNNCFSGDIEKFCVYLHGLSKKSKTEEILLELVATNNKVNGRDTYSTDHIPALKEKKDQELFLKCFSGLVDDLAKFGKRLVGVENDKKVKRELLKGLKDYVEGVYAKIDWMPRVVIRYGTVLFNYGNLILRISEDAVMMKHGTKKLGIEGVMSEKLGSAGTACFFKLSGCSDYHALVPAKLTVDGKLSFKYFYMIVDQKKAMDILNSTYVDKFSDLQKASEGRSYELPLPLYQYMVSYYLPVYCKYAENSGARSVMIPNSSNLVLDVKNVVAGPRDKDGFLPPVTTLSTSNYGFSGIGNNSFYSNLLSNSSSSDSCTNK